MVGGQPSKDAIGSLLYSSGVGKHTSIVFINGATDGKGKQTYQLSQYIWDHKAHQPNTHSFPITCPMCHCIYSWPSIPGHVTEKGSGFDLQCKTKLADGGRCTGTWRVQARPSSSTVPLPYVGTWWVM